MATNEHGYKLEDGVFASLVACYCSMKNLDRKMKAERERLFLSRLKDEGITISEFADEWNSRLEDFRKEHGDL